MAHLPLTTIATLLLALLPLAGCSSESVPPGADAAAASPRLIPLDSTLLHEEEEYVGEPRSIAVVPADGSLLVGDRFGRRVLHFAPSGELLGTFGRPGRGPGDFVGLTEVFLLNDSVLIWIL